MFTLDYAVRCPKLVQRLILRITGFFRFVVKSAFRTPESRRISVPGFRM